MYYNISSVLDTRIDAFLSGARASQQNKTCSESIEIVNKIFKDLDEKGAMKPGDVCAKLTEAVIVQYEHDQAALFHEGQILIEDLTKVLKSLKRASSGKNEISSNLSCPEELDDEQLTPAIEQQQQTIYSLLKDIRLENEACRIKSSAELKQRLEAIHKKDSIEFQIDNVLNLIEASFKRELSEKDRSCFYVLCKQAESAGSDPNSAMVEACDKMALFFYYLHKHKVWNMAIDKEGNISYTDKLQGPTQTWLFKILTANHWKVLQNDQFYLRPSASRPNCINLTRKFEGVIYETQIEFRKNGSVMVHYDPKNGTVFTYQDLKTALDNFPFFQGMQLKYGKDEGRWQKRLFFDAQN